MMYSRKNILLLSAGRRVSLARTLRKVADDHGVQLYTADNPAKDFVTPKALGWNTMMLRDRGQNIHPQDVDVPKAFYADVEISDLTEIFSSAVT
jgi:hypothetical protein